MTKFATKTSLFLSSLMPSVALAQDDIFDPTDENPDLPELPEGPQDFGEVIELIVKIGQWMFGLLMALSIVFILYAAFLYIIAQGNDVRIQAAKKILIYAIVGLVVAVIAGGASSVVQSFLTS